MSALMDSMVMGEMTEERLHALVGCLRRDVREELALGPLDEDGVESRITGETCRICATFRPWKRWAQAWVDAHPEREPKLGAAFRRTVLIMIPLAFWHNGDDLVPYGYIAGEGAISYERCLMIYRAAGWDG